MHEESPIEYARHQYSVWLYVPDYHGSAAEEKGPTISIIPALRYAIVNHPDYEWCDAHSIATRLFGISEGLARCLVRDLGFDDWDSE